MPKESTTLGSKFIVRNYRTDKKKKMLQSLVDKKIKGTSTSRAG